MVGLKIDNWGAYFTVSENEYIGVITRLREDMDFMFEWQEQYRLRLVNGT